MRKSKYFYPLLTLIPLILVALMIFGFSAQTGDESEGLSRKVAYWIIDNADTSGMTPREFEDFEYAVLHGVRKAAHFSEFAAFGFFLMLHLSTYVRRKTWLISGIISLFYASADEFHQLFVSDRAMQLTDVCIDFSGAVVGIAVLCLLMFLIKKKRNKRINDQGN